MIDADIFAYELSVNPVATVESKVAAFMKKRNTPDVSTAKEYPTLLSTLNTSRCRTEGV